MTTVLLADDRDCDAWDQTRALQEFATAVRNQDSEHADICIRAIDRLACWAHAIEQFRTVDSGHPVSADALMWLWTTFGYHVSDALNGNCLVLVDLLRDSLPPYAGADSVVLYRAELQSRKDSDRIGMSWTSDPLTARSLAIRKESFENDRALVLRTTAQPAAILAGPSEESNHLGEFDYLLDPRRLWRIDVLTPWSIIT